MRWPQYWSFSFSISPSKEHPELISFRMDWLDLLAGQGTLKSLLQHHTSKASILQRSAFFTVQLSHPYMTTGKTIALTRRTFVGKAMSLLSICYLGCFHVLARVNSIEHWGTCVFSVWFSQGFDQPRRHIKNQRHYFANKGPSSQGYGFSSSHVWM